MLGDSVEKMLSAVGITKDNVSAVIGRDCGCKHRQEQLNLLDSFVRMRFLSFRAWLINTRHLLKNHRRLVRIRVAWSLIKQAVFVLFFGLPK